METHIDLVFLVIYLIGVALSGRSFIKKNRGAELVVEILCILALLFSQLSRLGLELFLFGVSPKLLVLLFIYFTVDVAYLSCTLLAFAQKFVSWDELAGLSITINKKNKNSETPK